MMTNAESQRRIAPPSRRAIDYTGLGNIEIFPVCSHKDVTFVWRCTILCSRAAFVFVWRCTCICLYLYLYGDVLLSVAGQPLCADITPIALFVDTT